MKNYLEHFNSDYADSLGDICWGNVRGSAYFDDDGGVFYRYYMNQIRAFGSPFLTNWGDLRYAPRL